MAGNKRNNIPLVLAVVLALAAVFAVNRLVSQKTQGTSEEMVRVITAGRNLEAGTLIDEGACAPKVIPRSAAPSKAIEWRQRDQIKNHKMINAVSQGDYITLDDIGVDGGLSDMLGYGEWAVSISLNGGAITSRLHPGDEIAIIGTFDQTETVKSTVVGQEAKEVSRKITTVSLPQVRILALDVNRQQGGDQFVLSLPPQQAQILLAAEEQGISLSPALRKKLDDSNLNRITTGLVDSETFNNLAQGVERSTIPAEPTKK